MRIKKILMILSIVLASSAPIISENAIMQPFIWMLRWEPLLVLVNWEHTIPEGWQTDLTEIEEGYFVDRRMQQDLQAMLTAMRLEGLYPRICSAYRTLEEQQDLYQLEIENYLAEGLTEAAAIQAAQGWVAAPGSSEHQLGLAVDILDEGWMRMDESQQDTPVQQWLMDHCAEYGFILRYPVDKSEKTGIGYEPWHYRYVGKGLARAIMDSGLCMEEYIEILEKALGA